MSSNKKTTKNKKTKAAYLQDPEYQWLLEKIDKDTNLAKGTKKSTKAELRRLAKWSWESNLPTTRLLELYVTDNESFILQCEQYIKLEY